MASLACMIDSEDSFGPSVAASCRGGFDFTLLFEESILTILPSCIAVLWACLRMALLVPQPRRVKVRYLFYAKVLAYLAFTALEAALLGAWTETQTFPTRATLATLILTTLVPMVLMIVSIQEHVKCVRPSTFLTRYLGVSILLDLARSRTLFLLPVDTALAAINLTCTCLKVMLLLLELTKKRHSIDTPWIDPAPEATASIYSRALFIWINKLFVNGFRKQLTLDTLPPIDSALLAASRPQVLQMKWQKDRRRSSCALLLIFISHYRWSILAGVLPRLAYVGFLFGQPFLIEQVLVYVGKSDADRSPSEGFGLIGAYALVYIGMAITLTLYQHRTYRVLTEFRGSLVSLIYDKSLRMSSATASNAEAITLMSADIDRIGMGMHLIHETYASVIEIAIALWLLCRLVGISAAAPAVWFAVILGLGIPLATTAGNGQMPWLNAIEDRLAATTKTLGNLKQIRLMGLTQLMHNKLTYLRGKEISASRRYRFLTALVTATSYLPGTLAPVWCFGVYTLLAQASGTGTLTDSVAFSALTLISLLDQPSTYLLTAVEDMQIIFNSFKRIQDYLQEDEQEDARTTPGLQHQCSQSKLDAIDSVRVESVHSDALKEKELSQSLRDFQRGVVCSLRDVTVRYGPDKYPVLQCLNMDLPTRRTSMIIGPVGCGKSSLLKALIGEVPAMEGSIIASFKTAGYCPQSPWITRGSVRDNILARTSWDQSWYNTVLEACALQGDIAELPQGDRTMVGSRGSRLSGGQQKRVALARALYSREAVLLLDSVLAGLDNQTERHVLNAVFGPTGLAKKKQYTIIFATSSANHLHYADHVIVLEKDGTLARTGAPGTIVALSGLSTSDMGSEDTSAKPEESLLVPSDVEEDDLHDDPNLAAEDDDKSRRTGDLHVYAYYFRTAGAWLMLAYIATTLIYIFGIIFPSIWLQQWVNSNAVDPNNRIGYWLGIYGAVSFTAVIGCLASELMIMLVIVPRTSARFHEHLLTTTTRATTGYITGTDVGQITNRFSQDLELIDNDLPQSLDSFTLSFLSLIATAALVFTGSSYVSAAIPVCIAFLWPIQAYYLRTSRQLRLLDIEAKAPLFSHFIGSLRGLSSIRAYGWNTDYRERHLQALNNSQKPYYLLWCIQRWLALVLDLMVAGVAVLLVALATSLPSGETGLLGVALFNIVAFSSDLQNLVTQWTQLETAVGAVNRIRSYVSTVEREDGKDQSNQTEPKANWPSAGLVSFDHVSARYDTAEDPVLCDVGFTIQPGEKVAICGRTGSGKSSLIAALFRTLDLESGSISVDGVNIESVPRDILRQRLNIVTQDAVIFDSTIRDNIDPENLYSDDVILPSIRALHLDELFDSDQGLKTAASEEELSHGQRQLICLARAIVKPGRIIVLDEATSNVDLETDNLMQKVVRTHCKDKTLIVIAHKLNAVLDFDRIIVLDNGRVIESGKPTVLLEDAQSAFAGLYHAEKKSAPADQI